MVWFMEFLVVQYANIERLIFYIIKRLFYFLILHHEKNIKDDIPY